MGRQIGHWDTFLSASGLYKEGCKSPVTSIQCKQPDREPGRLIGNEQEPRWISGIEPPGELLRASIIEIYEKECREQPERLAELIAGMGRPGNPRRDRPLRSALAPERPLLFLGMGASYCSALAACSFLQSRGRFAVAMDAGEWLHYAGGLWDQVAGAVLLTTSGESAELVALLESDPGRPICLICNNEHSKCWAAAKIRLPILAGPEYANATKTYTNATAAADCACFRTGGASVARGCRAVARDLPTVPRPGLRHARRTAGFLQRGGQHRSDRPRTILWQRFHGRSVHPRNERPPGSSTHGRGLPPWPASGCQRITCGHYSRAGEGRRSGLEARPRLQRARRQSSTGIHGTQGTCRAAAAGHHGTSPEPWEAITSVLVSQALTLGLVEAFGANLKPRFQYGIMEQ